MHTAAFPARANTEPPACLSPSPSAWPTPSKPYFLLALDTSGSMVLDVAPAVAPTCGASYGTTRLAHARCAVRTAVQAFAGQVNMGLMGFARTMTGCNATCFSGCTLGGFPNDSPAASGCGAEPDPAQPFSSSRAGGNLLVPVQQDDYWNVPGAPSNAAQLMTWLDNDCTANQEWWSGGASPANGILRDAYRYLSAGWTNPVTAVTYPTPLGTSAQGERGCRSVNLIYITDGDEGCDLEGLDGSGNRIGTTAAENAAAALLNGFTLGGIHWSIKTHVIRLAGGTQAFADAVAAAGGTGASYSATNEAGVAAALTSILAVAQPPESCDNVDNNCNGCTDEGFRHSCDNLNLATCCTWKIPAQRTACGASACGCCAWINTAERTACLTNFKTTITAAKPAGDTALLPCTTPLQGQEPATWLCYDPGEVCDNLDNNCDGTVDEGTTKCGSPLHCPQPETCNGIDDNCDGLVDEGNVCLNNCHPSPEICDGCDNDCDGIVDNTVPTAACGLPSNPPQTPTYCTGVLSCLPGSSSVAPGGCLPGGGQTSCSALHPDEACNGVDDNCDGVVDNNVPSASCIPSGAPPGLVYDDITPQSACRKGITQCINGVTTCVGWVGPSREVCDGLDNDCNGMVDDNTPGVNLACGLTLGECKPGKTACVSGALTCAGSVGPQPETCDGKDNDCNGLVDDGALLGAPAAGQTGCWELPGNCCSSMDSRTGHTTTWCPPPGASCNGLGSLSEPCTAGTLVCQGAQGWVCAGGRAPAPEQCDGVDNDCNGVPDDGALAAPAGRPCGSNVGECVPGVLQCQGGRLACSGAGPQEETCNGKDDDCNGVVDDVLGLGESCTMAYDELAFPGPRTALPCSPGVVACGPDGALTCILGQAPQPEVCDGVDNDCDGQFDELGPSPEGINGSADPVEPTHVLGEVCGVDSALCTSGTWSCSGTGTVACQGAVPPKEEMCDCQDNDCDGQVDNVSGVALCSPGKDCVKTSQGCGCAPPCGTGEHACPSGQECVAAQDTATDMPLGPHCVPLRPPASSSSGTSSSTEGTSSSSTADSSSSAALESSSSAAATTSSSLAVTSSSAAVASSTSTVSSSSMEPPSSSAENSSSSTVASSSLSSTSLAPSSGGSSSTGVAATSGPDDGGGGSGGSCGCQAAGQDNVLDGRWSLLLVGALALWRRRRAQGQEVAQ